jgi:hypothetical protein
LIRRALSSRLRLRNTCLLLRLKWAGLNKTRKIGGERRLKQFDRF